MPAPVGPPGAGGKVPWRPTDPVELKRDSAWIYAGAAIFVLGFLVFVVTVWGLATHGFRDMHSYNLGRDGGNRDKSLEYTTGYRAGCGAYLKMALASEAALNVDDFLAGCRDAER